MGYSEYSNRTVTPQKQSTESESEIAKSGNLTNPKFKLSNSHYQQSPAQQIVGSGYKPKSPGGIS